MGIIKSQIRNTLYQVEIQSDSGNQLIADEPQELGGGNTGFSPDELLRAALAACTSATLRMYADRKGWDLQGVNLELDFVWDKDLSKTTIRREIHISGNLDDAQRERLLAIANLCPIHKVLSNPIEIITSLS
ncbi:OsmC family protein [Aquirufa ecclesiirivi]|uniref:OsmC family protein n=1 Tax=Aquirufa ecclesiirivi TaxID=2715124 RepID=UPI00140BDCBD|nr:OsmC family protein [Aquirufa ecclesiirivi]MDF0692538.1 OsmC family protein [Aquirufa ecclesiirivi]NHC48092.1 OsmC family protein [Aquirufa ecclesiirivi]